MAPHLTTSRQLPSTDRIARRRLMKQMVERRRRERIDLCLDNIKALVLTNLNKNPAEYEKMEKADILEMTVHYLARLVKGQRPNSARQLVYPDTVNQAHHQQVQAQVQAQRYNNSFYTNGFKNCVQQTRQFLDNASSCGSSGLKTRLVNHLQATFGSKNTTNSLSSLKGTHTVKSESNRDNEQKISNMQRGSYWRPW